MSDTREVTHSSGVAVDESMLYSRSISLTSVTYATVMSLLSMNG